MNVTLVTAIVMLVAWVLLVFVAQIPTGYVHLLYAGGTMLLARRVLLGAPSFRS